MTMPKIIQNAIRCPDGTIIVSNFTHDHKEHNGCFVDGGLEYSRRSVAPGVTSLVLYDTDPIDVCINAMVWGTRGKEGTEPLKYALLKSCETDHLKAILRTQEHITAKTREVITAILEGRGKQSFSDRIEAEEFRNKKTYPVMSMAVNSNHLDELITEYRKEDKRLYDLFKTESLKDLGIAGYAAGNLAFNLAWEEKHASGLSAVYRCLSNFAKVMKG